MTDFEKFQALHHAELPLLLPNVWNAKSAQIVENSGYKAMATTSGAIAESLGYKDGEQIPFEELFYMVKRIKASTTIPLSVDLERGYAEDTNTLNAYVQQLIDIGVAGINLEDAQGEEIYLKKLVGLKNYLLKTNQQLFINARTDGFLQKLDSPLEVTLRRAKLYEEAGADGLFVTGIQDMEIISKITSATKLPVNVVGISSLSSAAELGKHGVKRISMAVLLYKATYNGLEKMATAINSQQSTKILFGG
jgi:2-methylisocitrate lyase-like PEP mutase family enzyme